MNQWDILIIVILAAAACSVIFLLVRRKKRGRSCCGDCSVCLYGGVKEKDDCCEKEKL